MWKGRGSKMAPYFERGGNGEPLKGGAEVEIGHNGRKVKSRALVVGQDRVYLIPGECCRLYAGNVSKRGKGFENGEYDEVTKPRYVEGKSISTTSDGFPALVWRNDAQDKKP